MEKRALMVIGGALLGLFGLALTADPSTGQGEDAPDTRDELDQEFHRLRTELREAVEEAGGLTRDEAEELLAEKTRPTEEAVQEIRQRLAHIGSAQDAAEKEDEPDGEDASGNDPDDEADDDEEDAEPEASGEDD